MELRGGALLESCCDKLEGTDRLKAGQPRDIDLPGLLFPSTGMNSMADDEIFERTLCQLSQCHVFKIPVRKTAEGHRASDWPKEHTWTGKLKISAKGRLAIITLLDSNTSQIFASCSVTDDSCVERTLDSGRYFVLKIQNAQGRHAFIGLAFNERNDAFDFNVALQEHKAECEREDRAASEPFTASSGGTPLRDLSLKTGEKITVKLASAGNGVKKEKKPMGAFLPPPGSAGAAPRGLLAPPPGRGFLAPPPADTRNDFAASAAPRQLPAPAASSASDFGFGSPDPFSTPSFTSPPTTDAFGFPVSAQTKPTSTMKTNDPPNLIDF